MVTFLSHFLCFQVTFLLQQQVEDSVDGDGWEGDIDEADDDVDVDFDVDVYIDDVDDFDYGGDGDF